MVTRIGDDWFRAQAKDEQQLKRMRELSGTSFVVVPLRDHGQSFGAIGFGSFSKTRRYDREDLVFFRGTRPAMLDGDFEREPLS